jgi:hypothetical protein
MKCGTCDVGCVMPVADGCSRPSCDVCQAISTELVDRCVAKLNLRKSRGLDDLSAEYIVYAHPSPIIAIWIMLKLIANQYAPVGFCTSTIVSLIEDKSRNLFDIDNYRPITLIPAISKIFENVLLALFEDYLVSDKLQFGFKRNLSCVDVIFMLCITIDYL